MLFDGGGEVRKLERIIAPLDSTDIISLANEHKKNIGAKKATFMEGVLHGMMLRAQIPCIWEKQPMKHTSVMPTGGVYVRNCNGSFQTSMVNIEELEESLYCSSCGHVVEVLK